MSQLRTHADRTAFGLTALLAGAGVLHFAKPEPFDTLVPPVIPGPPRLWTLASGAAELVIAGLLAAPHTRRLGGRLASALFVAVYPANLQMAWDWRRRPWYWQVVSLGRLPFQADLVRRSELVHAHASTT